MNEEEGEEDAQEDALAAPAPKKKAAAAKKAKKAAATKAAFVGAPSRTESGVKFFAKAKVCEGRGWGQGAGGGGPRGQFSLSRAFHTFKELHMERLACVWTDGAIDRLLTPGSAPLSPPTSIAPPSQVGEAAFALGDVITLAPEEDDEEEAPAPLGLVQALWQTAGGETEVQVRVMSRGADTVLGDAASDCELFLTTKVATRPLAAAEARLTAARRERSWDVALRLQQFQADEEFRQVGVGCRAAAAAAWL